MGTMRELRVCVHSDVWVEGVKVAVSAVGVSASGVGCAAGVRCYCSFLGAPQLLNRLLVVIFCFCFFAKSNL
jgi:hypothetical protein